jgi:hypothetical protein
VVFEVADNRVGDADFFSNLEALRVIGGVAALMNDLLREDISQFNAERDRPRSGLAVYKTQSASPLAHGCKVHSKRARSAGTISSTIATSPRTATYSRIFIFDSYAGFMKSAKAGAESPTAFWLKLRRIGVLEGRDRRLGPDETGKQPRAAGLQDLDEARDAFALHMGETIATLWKTDALAVIPNPCPICTRANLEDAKNGAHRRQW